MSDKRTASVLPLTRGKRGEVEVSSPFDEIQLPKRITSAIVPECLREDWASVDASAHMKDRMRRALYRAVVLGQSWREAAAAEGYRDGARDVYRAAQNHKLLPRGDKEEILNRQRALIALSSDELQRRLIENPGSFSNWTLAKIQGVSVDKISAAEQWNKPSPDPHGGSGTHTLAEFVQKFLENGGSATISYQPPDPVELATTVGPAPDSATDVEPGVIDVTPPPSQPVAADDDDEPEPW